MLTKKSLDLVNFIAYAVPDFSSQRILSMCKLYSI